MNHVNHASLKTEIRRRVDWDVVLGPGQPRPSVIKSEAADDLMSVLAAFDKVVAVDDEDLLLKTAVEIAREQLGLKRAALFLLNPQRKLMLGSWGTDIAGNTVDEHHVMYEVGSSDLEVFRRADYEGVPYTILENCPIIEHRESHSVVLGQGWVASTPIRSTRGHLGMFFNDVGLSDEPVNEKQQSRVALFCSFLGILLDRSSVRSGNRSVAAPHNSLVVGILRLLTQDPSLGGKELASDLNISLSRLARVFKNEMGMSLVHYRNRLRLERFDVLVKTGTENLLEAALASGFGSYAQFHRVFVAERGAPPTRYLKGKASAALKSGALPCPVMPASPVTLPCPIAQTVGLTNGLVAATNGHTAGLSGLHDAHLS